MVPTFLFHTTKKAPTLEALILGGAVEVINFDFNTASPGIANYSYATGITHSPDDSASFGVCITYKRENNQLWQICRDFGTNRVYQRHSNSASSWTDWVLNYDHNLLTNSTELSSLASALGVVKFAEHSGFNGDMNDLRNWAWGYLGSAATNVPIHSSSFIVIPISGMSYPVQILFGDNDGANSGIYVRRYLYGSWSTWKRLDNQ